MNRTIRRNPARRETGDRTVVVDCRWLGHTGVGRFTDVLLQGLKELQPEGRWVLWGPQAVVDSLWGSASWAPSAGSPVRWGAQAGALRMPRADDTVFLHAVRPLLPRGRTHVVLHDTIPTRHARTALMRLMWSAFFLASTHLASTVIVYSDATRSRATHQLRLADRKLRRISLALDPALVVEVREARASADPLEVLLYVGQSKPHKNLHRAVAGFARSGFASSGGRFLLVGLSDDGEVARAVADAGLDGVEVVGRCSDAEMVRHLATARAVIQPSLEEGFGLTVAEALAAGVPVCCSDVPALREAAAGGAVLFDPLDPSSIAAAIDDVVGSRHAGVEMCAPRPPLPSPRELAEMVVAAIVEPPGLRG